MFTTKSLKRNNTDLYITLYCLDALTVTIIVSFNKKVRNKKLTRNVLTKLSNILSRHLRSYSIFWYFSSEYILCLILPSKIFYLASKNCNCKLANYSYFSMTYLDVNKISIYGGKK